MVLQTEQHLFDERNEAPWIKQLDRIAGEKSTSIRSIFNPKAQRAADLKLDSIRKHFVMSYFKRLKWRSPT